MRYWQLAFRGLVLALCLLGVVVGTQRTLRTVAPERRAPDGLTATERANLDLARDLGQIAAGSARDADLVSGTRAFEEKYERHRLLMFAHVFPGSIFLLLAPLQFSNRLRSRYRAVHRWTGRVLVTCVIVSGVAGLVFGLFMPFAGTSESIIIAVFGALFLYGAIRGWRAIRAGDRRTHREWMIRVFAVGVGIATTRVASLLVILLTSLDMRTGFVTALWIGFSVSVLAGELVIRRSRVPAPVPAPVSA